MKKHRITVYDYQDATHNASVWQYDSNNPPETIKYEVDAWCVGGKYGIKAFFIRDGLCYEAAGDDGHWWLVVVFSAEWLEEMIKVLTKVKNKQ